MRLVHDAFTLAWKDLRVEARTLRSTASIATLAGASLILVGLLLGPSPQRLRDVAPGVTWVVLLYAALAIADQVERIDRADDAFSALWLALEDRRALYIGRVISLTIALTILHVAIWTAAVVLLDLRAGPAALLILPVSALVSVAAASGIALVSPLVASAGDRALLLSVLLVPLLVPTFLAGVQATTALLASEQTGAGPWVAALAIQAALFAGVGLLTYDEAARPG